MSNMSYTAGFYDNVGQNVRSAEKIVSLLSGIVQPKSVVDIGCGVGAWLNAFLKVGIKDLMGVEGTWIREDQLIIPASIVRRQDLNCPIHFDRNFDLAVCVEVAEHLPASKAPELVRELAALAPVVMFSAAIPFQGGTNHLNEQWPGYWIDLFRAERYAVIDFLRMQLWNDPEVRWFYAQNLMLFVQQEFLRENPRLSDLYLQANLNGLPLVHPRGWLKHTDPSVVSMRNLVRFALKIVSRKRKQRK